MKRGGWWLTSFFGRSCLQGVLGCGWCWVLFMVVVGSIVGHCVMGHCDVVVVVTCERGGLGRTWDGGTYHGVMKYTMTMNVIHRRLVAMSLSATWHLNSVLERNG